MRNSTKILFLALLICLSGCRSGSASDKENTLASDFSFSSENIVQSEATPEEKLDLSKATQNLKSVDFSSEQNALKGYIKFARSEIYNDFLNGDECMITLQNIFGNEKPEMILSFRTADNVESKYLYAMDENSVPNCMRSFVPSTEFSGLYMDSLNTYYITYRGCHPFKDNLYWMNIDRLELPKESKVSPDFAEYQNSDALDFINNTHTYFVRYDNWDWDSEKQSWKNPEKLAAMFYYEDSGLYEAYSVSKQMLDLAAFEINDYINDDGNHIYSYLPGENYLVSRREYEQIKSKVFEILTEVTDEPEISSGWINIDDVDKWIDSLA